ncbi:hypothetical protein [Streptomyces sp. NPDC021224]|uniref:hypothetical protein n=1 Tax=unclassified Streptomyces TaxID=2593676 RepID=UPI00378AD58F
MASGRAALRVLGLGAAEEAAYALLVETGPVPLAVLAGRWRRKEALCPVLAALRGRGLAERLPGDPPRHAAAPPGAVLDRLLAEEEHRLTRARHQVAELAAAYQDARRGDGDESRSVAEAVTGRAAVGRRLARIRLAARREVRSLGPLPDPRLPSVGAAHRALYAPGRAAGSEAAAAGQQVRTLPELPVRLCLVDDRCAVLAPAEGGGEPDEVVVVHPSALLDALALLFESLWDRAAPRPGQDARLAERPAVRAADHPGDRPADPDARLLGLLLAGLTDAASARQLGVSQRTVQRRVAALLASLGASTRFQAGVQSAFRTLPPPH